jgi:hypothetical protein
MEKKFHYKKPALWEILVWVIWLIIPPCIDRSIFSEFSAIAVSLYSLGFMYLISAVQIFRWHHQEKLSWNGKYKIYLNVIINELSISLLVLVAFGIDAIRGIFH